MLRLLDELEGIMVKRPPYLDNIFQTVKSYKKPFSVFRRAAAEYNMFSNRIRARMIIAQEHID